MSSVENTTTPVTVEDAPKEINETTEANSAPVNEVETCNKENATSSVVEVPISNTLKLFVITSFPPFCV